MAHIKCRYQRPGCVFIDEPTHPSWDCYEGWCVNNKECSSYRSNKKLTCEYFVWRLFEFETTVKNYEFCDDYDHWGFSGYQQPGLKIKGQFIDAEDINYLEIDGRVIVGKEETHG